MSIVEIADIIKTFLGVFFLISLVRLIVMFIISLLSNPPKQLVINNRELIYYGICISYLITLILV
jgi:hypothetical protein